MPAFLHFPQFLRQKETSIAHFTIGDPSYLVLIVRVLKCASGTYHLKDLVTDIARRFNSRCHNTSKPVSVLHPSKQQLKSSSLDIANTCIDHLST